MESTNQRMRHPLVRPRMFATDEATYLLMGGELYAIQGQDAPTVAGEVLARVDGFSTADDIATAVAQTGTLLAAGVHHVLRMLVELGAVVVDSETPETRPLRQQYLPQIAYFGQHVTHPTACQQRLQASHVTVLGLEYPGTLVVQQLGLAGIGHVRAVGNPVVQDGEAAFLGTSGAGVGQRHSLLAARLRTLECPTQYEGLDVSPGTPLVWDRILTDCDLAVVILPRPLPALLRALNQACLARAVPYLPVWFEVTGAQIGPLVVPGATPCMVCLELWRRPHLARDTVLALPLHDDATLPVWHERAWLLPWASTVASMAVGEVVTALTRYRQPASYGHELFLSTTDWQVTRTPVWRLPRCPACSPLAHLPSPQPFALAPAPQEDAAHDA